MKILPYDEELVGITPLLKKDKRRTPYVEIALCHKATRRVRYVTVHEGEFTGQMRAAFEYFKVGHDTFTRFMNSLEGGSIHIETLDEYRERITKA